MKTPEDVINRFINEENVKFNQERDDWMIEAMEEYAKLYHESKVKKLNIPAVSNSLPVDYLQTEMIKAIKELAKESTAPDKVTPDWMENDIKRGMQWMHKRLTGNDC